LLPARLRLYKDSSSAKKLGMRPERIFPTAEKEERPEIRANSVGIVPVRRFWSKEMNVRVVTLPNSVGIVPVKLL